MSDWLMERGGAALIQLLVSTVYGCRIEGNVGILLYVVYGRHLAWIDSIVRLDWFTHKL